MATTLWEAREQGAKFGLGRLTTVNFQLEGSPESTEQQCAIIHKELANAFLEGWLAAEPEPESDEDDNEEEE